MSDVLRKDYRNILFYEGRLNGLGLLTLELRRPCGILLQTVVLVSVVNFNDLLKLNPIAKTRVTRISYLVTKQ